MRGQPVLGGAAHIEFRQIHRLEANGWEGGLQSAFDDGAETLGHNHVVLDAPGGGVDFEGDVRNSDPALPPWKKKPAEASEGSSDIFRFEITGKAQAVGREVATNAAALGGFDHEDQAKSTAAEHEKGKKIGHEVSSSELSR